MLRGLSKAGKRLIKNGKRLLCCCLPEAPNCGCCINSGTEDAECVDTGLKGQAGEDYCTETLGGIPMKAVWFDRTLRCIPCEYEVPGASTIQPTCPVPPNGCEAICDDLTGDPPGFLFFALNGPFNPDPACVGCEQVRPPNGCFTEECSLLRGMFASVLSGGIILDQVVTSCGVPPNDYPCYDCDYHGSVTVEACVPDSCLPDPEGNPCQFLCQATLTVNAGFNSCGMWFAVTAVANCGPSQVDSGCNNPHQFDQPSWGFNIQGGAGFDRHHDLVFDCDPANCLDGFDTDVEVFGDSLDFLGGDPDVFLA